MSLMLPMSLTPFKKIDRLSRDPMANSLGACVVIKSSNSILSLKQKFLKFSYIALQHQKSKNIRYTIVHTCMRTLHIYAYIAYTLYVFIYRLCIH